MYAGRERRRHQMYVTNYREYHVRDDLCVGVRNLVNGRWVFSHPALGRRVFTLPARPGGPHPGDQVFLEPLGTGSLTATGFLLAVTRPPKQATAYYHS